MNDRIQDARGRGGWAVLDTGLFDLGLNAYAIAVYAALLKFANSQTSAAFPAVGTLAEMVQVSPNTVRKALADLKDAGVISVQHRQNPDNPTVNLTNLYTLLPMPKPVGGTSLREVGVLHHVKGGTSPREGELDEMNQKNKNNSPLPRDEKNPLKDERRQTIQTAYERTHADPDALRERVEAMPTVTIDDFTTTADQLIEAEAALRNAIGQALGFWRSSGNMYYRMLAGKPSKARATEFDEHAFTPEDGGAVSDSELRAWYAWYRRQNPTLNVPTTPHKLKASILQYRLAMAEKQRRPSAPSRYDAPDAAYNPDELRAVLRELKGE